MKYLLDTNIIFSLLNKSLNKGLYFCITEDVLSECEYYQERIPKIKALGLEILETKKKHLEKLKEVLVKHGDNFELVRLYSGKGKADVGILAYILAERDNCETLFPEEYILITKDKPLSDAAKEYGIKCLSQIPNA